MTSDVFGSSPELGSSQKRYLGCIEMARAMAARFCMPPLSSAGYLSWASIRLTRSKHSWARFLRSLYDKGENISNGNITFSSTESESNRAEPWKSMPISRRSKVRSFLFIVTKLRPS